MERQTKIIPNEVKTEQVVSVATPKTLEEYVLNELQEAKNQLAQITTMYLNLKKDIADQVAIITELESIINLLTIKYDGKFYSLYFMGAYIQLLDEDKYADLIAIAEKYERIVKGE